VTTARAAEDTGLAERKAPILAGLTTVAPETSARSLLAGWDSAVDHIRAITEYYHIGGSDQGAVRWLIPSHCGRPDADATAPASVRPRQGACAETCDR
jgi:hypothetical protein